MQVVQTTLMQLLVMELKLMSGQFCLTSRMTTHQFLLLIHSLCQHQVKEFADLIAEKYDTEVKYAIHPVAGRMPGHMNVLLAEANVPYDQLVEMEDINPRIDNIDVAVVIGANDVVTPAARNDENSPIYGMPILNVDQAQSVIMMKRSMSSGFAGVQNELFFLDKTMMLFGDAKDSVEKITAEVKDL